MTKNSEYLVLLVALDRAHPQPRKVLVNTRLKCHNSNTGLKTSLATGVGGVAIPLLQVTTKYVYIFRDFLIVLV